MGVDWEESVHVGSEFCEAYDLVGNRHVGRGSGWEREYEPMGGAEDSEVGKDLSGPRFDGSAKSDYFITGRILLIGDNSGGLRNEIWEGSQCGGVRLAGEDGNKENKSTKRVCVRARRGSTLSNDDDLGGCQG